MTQRLPTRINYRGAVIACMTLALALALAPQSSHAFLGLLGKLGSAAGKGGSAAGAAGKGAAAGGAAVAGAEVAEGANAAAQAAKAAKATTNVDELSKASGLGKAVPDDIAAMLGTKGKTLLDVPDPGTRSWLSLPSAKLGPLETNLMVRDYVRLLEGKAAAGPAKTKPLNPADGAAPKLPTAAAPNTIPWHAVELLARAAHVGHKGAQIELDRVCRNADTAKATPAYCVNPARTVARKS